MIKDIYSELKNELYGVKRDVLLKNFTTYKIGGLAKYFFISRSEDNLLGAVMAAKRLKLPLFVFGGGSNILISDKGFNGLVVKIENADLKFKDNKIIAGAGINLTKLAYVSADKRLSGLEWSAGIPGTLGGAIYGNAQAFGTKISDAVLGVVAINTRTLEVKKLSNKQCQFSLKNSIFKGHKGRPQNLVIVSAVLALKRERLSIINNKIKDFINHRKTKHPIKFPSAGSTFINPVIKIKNKKLLEKFPELMEFNKSGVIPAGFLIQKSGLSGKKIGKAKISEKHANFIVNTGGAKARDVLHLINLAKKKVKENFGINLETEVQFIGF